MSVTHIPEKIKIILWGKAAGRCQYKGCNEILFRDSTTQAEFNQSYIAHIIADSPNGPRGHATLSEELKNDISNLMLLCDVHHRLIDKGDVDGHPTERLEKMKKDHEARIELQTDVHEDMESYIVLYGANIGGHTSPLNIKEARTAILPHRYSTPHPIEIGFKNSAAQDDSEQYWQQEIQNLNVLYNNKVKNLIDSGHIKHLSVFALAPQPLLIELGRLLGDINKVTTHQRRREPSTWQWSMEDYSADYQISKPSKNHKIVALNLSLSATISDERIINTLGEEISIWKISLEAPHNDFLHSPSQLSHFRLTMRKLMNEIKLSHGQDTELNIFPAVPASVAIECGRVWMPKADMPLHIYEQNTKRDGFFKAHTIRNA